MAVILQSSKSGRKHSGDAPQKRSHARSYSKLQKSKQRAYSILQKYSKRKGSGKKARLKGQKRTAFKKKFGKVLGIAAGIAVVGLIIGFIVGVSWLAQVSASLPQPGELVDRAADESTKIYSADGKHLYTFEVRRGKKCADPGRF